MSTAVVFETYGDPDVLHTIDAAPQTPGPGELQIAVEAAGVQPFDALFRSGAIRQFAPARFPQRLGNEFAGTVTAVGDGVHEFALGDEVLGWAVQTCYAEHIVTSSAQVVPKPATMPWTDAGVLPASGQTASTALDVLGCDPGDTILIHAAAGGVGSFAVQIAVARGATVIGTASGRNHDYLRSLGAIPVEYGAGLTDRVHRAAPKGIDAALVAVSDVDALTVSAKVVRDLSRIGVIAYSPHAARLGIQTISTDRSTARLAGLTDLYVAGTLRISIQETYPLEHAADAHRAIETGHVRGKIALTPR